MRSDVRGSAPVNGQFPSARSPGKSRLAGTGRVADELYLIGHHEVTGRPYLSPRSAGTGVAGGLLAELMAAEVPVVTVQRGCLFPLRHQESDPVGRYARPADPVAAHVLDVIMAEPEPRPVREWLLFLGMTSAAEVAGRLERSGYLTRRASRVPWRARRLVPTDLYSSHCALLRAGAGLEAAGMPALSSVLLAGLTVACGLGFRFSALPGASVRTVEEATGVLSRPLRELVAHVQAAADSSLLSARK
jgi:Golgi phosphoprotein 3 (GPP34)